MGYIVKVLFRQKACVCMGSPLPLNIRRRCKYFLLGKLPKREKFAVFYEYN